MATDTITNRIGAALKKMVSSKGSLGWHNPHMVAASRAISERIPLVDFVAEVRDARVPLSSEYGYLRNYPSTRRIVVMNKMDLADKLKSKEWIRYFEQQKFMAYGVNSHNKDSIKEFLNFLHARVREFRNNVHTTTILLLGIPNVGKSALANSLHQIGRISAAEKGKLKHATVSPLPGETKDIISLKIGSHPNIYVLDSPGILPQILDVDVGAKLALTGVFHDGLVGEEDLARYFLAILNLSHEYKKWEKLSTCETTGKSYANPGSDFSGSSELQVKPKKVYRSDHTQDCVVQAVRRTLFETASAFKGGIEDEEDLVQLIEEQLTALRDAFHVRAEPSEEEARLRVAAKLLNLYRTGRLGHYTLDSAPRGK